MEREMRRKLNEAFKTFTQKVERMTNDAVDFDSPFPELGFTGVPHRSACSLKPTSSCLVNLIEWPPFVITLEEVEFVHFERVSFQLKHFDMVFVFKDYSRKTQMVQAIPSTSLDSIKEWLNSCDIRYTEGPSTLNWVKIMKTVTDDPEGFFENGGWSFLASDSEGEDDEDEESDSEAYSPEESGESDEESDEDEEEGSATDEGSDEEGSLGSDESSGKDWSDLEEEAAKDDKRKEIDEREKDGHNDRKRHHSSHHRGPPSKKRR